MGDHIYLLYNKTKIYDDTLGTEVNFGGASTTSPNFIFSRPGKSSSSPVLAFLCFFFFSSRYLYKLKVYLHIC